MKGFKIFLNLLVLPFIAIRSNQKKVIAVRNIEISMSPKKAMMKTE
ncbi:hypothetical protein [Chryseobacterium bernardetii]